MGTEREEVIIQMGVDNSKLDAQLGMTKQQFNKFKRDIDKDIAAGSMPEYFKTASKAAKESADSMAHSFKSSFREIREFFGLSILGAIGSGLLKAWDLAMKQLADVRFGNTPIADLRSQMLEVSRQNARQNLKDRDEAIAAHKKATEEALSGAELVLKKHEELGNLRAEQAIEETKTDKEKQEKRLKFLQIDEQIAAQDLETAKADGDRAKILDAQIKFDNAHLAMLRQQHSLERAITAEKNAQNAPRRARAQETFAAGTFDAELSRMVALQAEMATRGIGGNQSSMDRFRSDAIEFNALRNSIQQRLQGITNAKADPKQQLMEQILDVIAPVTKEGGVPVVIKGGGD